MEEFGQLRIGDYFVSKSNIYQKKTNFTAEMEGNKRRFYFKLREYVTTDNRWLDEVVDNIRISGGIVEW